MSSSPEWSDPASSLHHSCHSQVSFGSIALTLPLSSRTDLYPCPLHYFDYLVAPTPPIPSARLHHPSPPVVISHPPSPLGARAHSATTTLPCALRCISILFRILLQSSKSESLTPPDVIVSTPLSLPSPQSGHRREGAPRPKTLVFSSLLALTTRNSTADWSQVRRKLSLARTPCRSPTAWCVPPLAALPPPWAAGLSCSESARQPSVGTES